MANCFDPSLYPKTYRVPLFYRLLRCLVVAIAIYLAFALCQARMKEPIWANIYAAILSTILLSSLYGTFTSITLYADRIERSGWFGKTHILRNNIAGKIINPRTKGCGLIAKDDPVTPPILLPADIQEDDAWRAWMADIQNLKDFLKNNR